MIGRRPLEQGWKRAPEKVYFGPSEHRKGKGKASLSEVWPREAGTHQISREMTSKVEFWEGKVQYLIEGIVIPPISSL